MTDALGSVHDLPLQIGHVDRVVIDECDRTDSGRGKVKRRR